VGYPDNVLADDEHPHLFMPFREGSAWESELPADHVHGPLYLEFDEGVERFGNVLAELVPSGASIAVDELTGAMRHAASRLFPAGPPSDAALVVGPAKLSKTPASWTSRNCSSIDGSVKETGAAIEDACAPRPLQPIGGS